MTHEGQRTAFVMTALLCAGYDARFSIARSAGDTFLKSTK